MMILVCLATDSFSTNLHLSVTLFHASEGMFGIYETCCKYPRTEKQLLMHPILENT